MTDCQRCGFKFSHTNAKFCGECGHDNSWLGSDMDRPEALKKYVTALPPFFFDQETTPEALNAFSLSLRERFKISFEQHQTIFAALTEKKLALAAMMSIHLEFDENIVDAYAGHDTHLHFRLTNPQSSPEIFKVSLEWDDPETPDHQDYKASSAGFLKPGQQVDVAGTHMFVRAGPKEISELILTLENQFFDKARFLVFPFRFKVANSAQHVVNHITTHNQISIEGRGVVDASGAGTVMSQNELDRDPRWIPLKFSLILDDDFYSFIESKLRVEQALKLEQQRLAEEKKREEERRISELKRLEDEALQRSIEERERQIQEQRIREQEEKSRIEYQKALRREEERFAEERRLLAEDAKKKAELKKQQEERQREIDQKRREERLAEQRRLEEDAKEKAEEERQREIDQKRTEEREKLEEQQRREKERQIAEQQRQEDAQREAAEKEIKNAEKKKYRSLLFLLFACLGLLKTCLHIADSDSVSNPHENKVEAPAPSEKRADKSLKPPKKPASSVGPAAIPLSEQAIAHISVFGVRGSRAAAWNVRIAPQSEIDESVKKSCEEASKGVPCERLLSGHFSCVAVFNGSNNFVWAQAGNTLDEVTNLGASRCQEKNGSACTMAESGSRCVDSSSSAASPSKPIPPQAKSPEFIVSSVAPSKNQKPSVYAAIYVNPDSQFWGGAVGYSGSESTDQKAKERCESNGGMCRKYSSSFARCYAVYTNASGKGIWVKLGGSTDQVVNEGKSECESFFGAEGSPCNLTGDLCAPEKN